MSLKVCLQMYSVREYMHFDPFTAFERAAESFHYIQMTAPLKTDIPGKYYGHTSAEWKDVLLEKTDAQIIGGYLPQDKSLWETYLKFFSELGAKQVIIHIDYFPTMQILEEKCRFYSEFGRKCKELGIQLLYENHYHEFQMLEGKTILERLMEGTDPELFSLSLNQYWTMRGLVEPKDVLEKYHDRIRMIVQEDYPLSEIDKFNMWKFYRYHPIAYNIQYENVLQGNEFENILPVQCELFTELGDGIIPLQPIIDQANGYSNIEYVVLKQDYTRYENEFDSIRRTAENYKKIRNVSW